MPSYSPTRCYFYPRSPCGERRAPSPPRREYYKISIHALLAESDDYYRRGEGVGLAFLSTLSLRRATTSLVVIGTNCIISIHALLAESDGRINDISRLMKISIHALLAESDSSTQCKL